MHVWCMCVFVCVCLFVVRVLTLANNHLACYVPPQRYPILMYLGNIFENGRLCAKANGPNLNGCCFHTYQGEVAGEVVIRQVLT